MSGFTEKQKRIIFERDDYTCVPHGPSCNGVLVVHHRANRGMGSRKSANVLSNGLTVCAGWNGAVEAVPDVAKVARSHGWKIPKSLPPDLIPVFYPGLGESFLLDDDGGRTVFVDDVPF